MQSQGLNSSTVRGYGIQQVANWAADDVSEKSLCDQVEINPGLWDICVGGENLVLTIVYGTSRGAKLVTTAPFRGQLPGSVQIQARKQYAIAPAKATISIARVEAPGPTTAQRIAIVGPVPGTTKWVTALADTQVQQDNVAITALLAGQRLRVCGSNTENLGPGRLLCELEV